MDDHGDAELEGEQASGVVDQAFAFEDGDDASWQADAFRDGGGGDGVGGGHYGAEHNAKAPIKGSEGIVRRRGYAKYRESNQAKGEEQDAGDVVFEIAPGGEPCAGVEERRQNHQENYVGIHGDFGNLGNEAESEAGDDENDGVGNLNFAGQRGESDYEEEE